MTPREMVDRIDAGRRMTTTILQRCDLGLDPAATIRELAPNLSEVAVDAARKLVELTAFHFASTAMVLTGLVPDEALETAEIPEPPGRPVRQTPDEIAVDWLLRDLTAPHRPRRPRPTAADRRAAADRWLAGPAWDIVDPDPNTSTTEGAP